jgi:hypothetical protein
MSRRVPRCGWLLLAIALACPASVRASAPSSPPAPDKPPPGYHDKNVNVGGRDMTIRVPDEHKSQLKNSEPSDGHYDPSSMNINRTSSFADKTFSTRDATLAKDDTAEEAHDQKRFVTGSYDTGSYNQANRTFQTTAYKDSSRTSSDFAKAYQLPAAASEANRTFAVKGSDYQGKKALIADNPKEKTDPFATPWAQSDKRFFDPAMTHVKRDPYAAANGLDVKHLNELPNRPLTIDEVRNLINHEQIPNLDAPPDPASKPLNDPEWEPPTQAPMLNDKAAPATPPPDEAKAGELPSPGMLAKPESDEPPPK